MHSTLKNLLDEAPAVRADAVVGQWLTPPDRTGKRLGEGGLRLAGRYKQRGSGTPLVTIITVCLNAARTLEQCLTSVFRQSWENVEYLVIDGGSTDGTLDLIRKHEHALDYWVSEPDGGLYQAMNKGLALASGDYVLILNSDDWYTPDCVESLVRAKKYSGADSVSALAQVVDGEGKPTEVMRTMPYDASVRLRMPLRHETMLLSAYIYDRIGRYDEQYRISADFDLTVKLYEAGCTLYELQRPLLHFRNDGVSNTDVRRLFDERVAIICRRFPFLGEADARLLADRDHHTYRQLLELSRRHPEEERLTRSIRCYCEDNARYSQRPQWKQAPPEEPVAWPVAGSERQTPLVSVILPVYNGQATLAACLDSVLAQTLENFELVCVNDASPDDSQGIIDDYRTRDPRIVSLVNDENIGLGATRNRGIRHARGAYVFHIDPDDTIPPAALETLHAAAVRYGSDLVKGAYLREQFHHHTALNKPEVRNALDRTTPTINVNARDLPELFSSWEGHWSCLYRIDLARGVPYPTDLKMGQDAIFLVRAYLQARKITIINDVVYRYRLNPSSTMNAFGFRKYLDALEWRRRAWHVLNDAGLRSVGDPLMQGYSNLLWHELFFRSYSVRPDASLLKQLADAVRSVVQETGMTLVDNRRRPHVRVFFEHLLSGQDDKAADLIAEVMAKSDAPAGKTAPAPSGKETAADASGAGQNPLISVILPVYNCQATLAACLDSVLAQTLENFELICVNDVSPDDSQKIIDDYRARDPRIVSLVNDKNIGHGASRNHGVRHARGAYVFHVDPDDTIPPKALETLYAHAVKHGSDMVRGAYLRQHLPSGKQPRRTTKQSLCRGGAPIINTHLMEMPELLRTTEGHWSFLYEAGLAKQVPYPTDLKMGPDSLFMASVLSRARRITIIDEVVYHYRDNPASAMNTFNFRKYRDALEWRRRAWHVLNDSGFRSIGNRLLDSYWGKTFFFNLASTASRAELFEFMEAFRSAFADTKITQAGHDATDFLKALIPLILQGRDEEALHLMLSHGTGHTSNQTDASPTTGQTLCPVERAFTSKEAKLRVATFVARDEGGAGTGSLWRVEALREHGIDARMFSLVANSGRSYVVRVKPDLPSLANARQHEVWKEVIKLVVGDIRKLPGYCASEMFSLPGSVLDFRKHGAIIDAHDVIHLHWVVGMMDYEHAGEVLSSKPIVWTLADMNAFTGGCHYSEGCEGYKQECRGCPLLGGKSDVAHETWKIKKRAYDKLENLHIVCPSPWIAERARDSSLLGDRPIHCIPNPLPANALSLTAKTVARIRLGLPLKKKLLLFGSENLTSIRKGGDLLKAALRHFCAREPRQGVELIVFGSGSIDVPLPARSLGYISDIRKLAMMYAAADAYLFPSREDNAPLTVGEALMCGTPVVAFPVGNVRDLVEDRVTGYVANHLDTADFASGIEWALDVSRTDAIARSVNCRLQAHAYHDPGVSAARHEAVYELAMQGSRMK